MPTAAEISDEITRVLKTGEEWRMGDVERRTRLRDLMALEDRVNASTHGVTAHVVAFQAPTAINDA